MRCLANHEHAGTPRYRFPAYVTTLGRKTATLMAHLYLNDIFEQGMIALSRRLLRPDSTSVHLHHINELAAVTRVKIVV
jgi:hypothetical protein